MPPSWERPEVTLAPSPRGSDFELARRFGIDVATALDPMQWQLVRASDRMELRAPSPLQLGSLSLDVADGAMARRLRTVRVTEPLPRACGLHRRERAPTVHDVTAGLCRDAMVLARLGCAVVAIERVPALALLAHDAIASSWLAPRLDVRLGDGAAWLHALPPEHTPDVVLLDPMFADEGRAQVKKEMQICRALAGPPVGDGDLLALARRVARERVVVKRQASAEPLAAGVSFAVPGERVRFDVYLRSAPAAPPAPAPA